MSVFGTHGAISWHELNTTDPKAAMAFYGQLFGWEFEPHDPNYTAFKAGGQPTGGVMGIPPSAPNMPPSWGLYVTVTDVDAIAAKVPQLGGKICYGPKDIPDVGRFCVIQDPQGATLCAIQYMMK